ncbi:hypothetical protein FRB99_005585, partial [Tulasnella sp. 403]
MYISAGSPRVLQPAIDPPTVTYPAPIQQQIGMSTLGTPDAHIIFDGRNGRSCEKFIVAVRRKAFAEGKDRDYEWMARFATTCFEGRALRWHIELPDKVRNDWLALERALNKDFLSLEEEEERDTQERVSALSIIPTPAAAIPPVPAAPPIEPISSTGRIRLKIEGTPTHYWVDRHHKNGMYRVITPVVTNALQIKLPRLATTGRAEFS